jgi:regulator of sigma E protease
MGLDFGFAVLAFFVVIGPLILIHEFGHFIIAKWHGIQVEEFGIGYPPRLFTLFERGGTRYTINAIPLGGFVRPKGEDDPGVEGGLAAAPKRARLAVLSAGAAANLLAAYVLLVATFMLGWPVEEPGARVELVEPGSPAAEAGLQPGDIVLYADDTYIATRDVLIGYIYSHTGQPVALQVERGGQRIDATITPRRNPPEGQGPTGIQVGSMIKFRQHTLFEAMGGASGEMWTSFRFLFIELPALVIRGLIPLSIVRPVSVVGISQLGGQAIEESIQINQWWPILRLTSYISMALGLTNLLPLPALDGGRIMFVLLEAIRGRRIDPQREGLVHLVGLAVLMATMLIFVYLDIVDPLVVQ